tara:strand:+ start:292 stop:1728 length:1437 start_codon:yes stop_codon:yes gene_type:complete
MSAIVEVKYFNSFILRKTLNDNTAGVAVWNGSRGNNTYPKTALANDNAWFVEESRIRGGFNNTDVGYGAKAYLVEDEPRGSRRSNAMIYSGIFNSRTGINNTNVFSVANDITKAVDPANGSIQKLYAEDTKLLILQEKKASFSPIDKDVIYTAEGSTTITASDKVIGTNVPYAGNFGISKNPESFAVYGYRKYFTDKDRNAVLRLSQDGITEISNYGMIDFFRDEFSVLGDGKMNGAWDIYNKQYVVSIQPKNVNTFKTLSFDEQVQGWTSLYSYKPQHALSLKSNYYTLGPSSTANTDTAGLYQQYISTVPRAYFYGVQGTSSVEFIFNPKVSMSKVFKTINYEGSNGWQVDSFVSDLTGIGSVDTDFLDFATTNTKDTTSLIYSYNQGAYDNYGNIFPSTLTPPVNRAGFTRKENKYMANLVNSSAAASGEVIFGASMTGIKGYFATVKISNDTVTDPGGMKELFAASSDYIESAY